MQDHCKVVTMILLLLLIMPWSILTQKTFTQLSGNNDWATASNWNPQGVPTSLDDVVIPYSQGEYTVTINSGAQCRSLHIGGPSAGLTGVKWDPSNTQTLAILSGTLSINGNCTVYQSGILGVGGTGITGLSPTGTSITIKGGAEFGTGTHTISSLSLLIASGGYMNVLGEPNGLILADAASLIVQTGGNLTLASQAGIINTDKTPVLVINYGTFICAPAPVDNFVTKLATPFLNFGTVSVTSGTVSFDHNGTWHGTLSIVGSTVQITSGTHQFFGDSTIQGNGTLQIQNDASITLQGMIEISYFVLSLGSSSVYVDNHLETTKFANFVMLGGSLTGSSTQIQSLLWAGGDISMSALSVNSLQINGDFTASILGTPLTVKKQAAFQNTTHLLMFNSTFILAEGATMNFDKEIYFICNKTDTISALQIGGTLEISYPSTTTLTCALEILPNGVVSTVAGILDIQTPVTSSGTLDISAPSVVILETDGSFFASSSLVGSGSLNCQSCNIHISGQVNIGTLNFPAGNISVQADQGLSGYSPTVQYFNQSGSSSLHIINNSPSDLNFIAVNLVFTGGSITSNQNAKLNLKANIVITNTSTFYGVEPYLFTNVAYVNNGTTTFYGNGAMKLWQDSIIYNAPSGVMTVQGSLTTSQNDLSGYQSELQNYGRFQVNDGSTATLAINFRNLGSGSLVVGGQLFISSGFFTQEDSSSCNLSLGGLLELANAGLFLGGSLQGKGLINGAVTLDGATLHVNSESTLTISSEFLQRGQGIIEVDVSSDAQLQLQSLGQISGGGFVLYSSTGKAPTTKQFVSAQSIVGRGIDNIYNASLNSTNGLSYTNTTGALFAIVALLPQITTISPLSGPAGTLVTITGSNFVIGEVYWNISVVFQGESLPAVLATRLSLVFSVPMGSGTDNTVYVFADGRVSNKLTWSYSPPIIQSVEPQSGPTLGANLVTIEGNNFGTELSLVQVNFGSFGTCDIVQLSNTQILCTAPAGLGTNISVIVVVNQQQSPPSLYTYFAPVLLSVYPSAVVLEDSAVGVITVTGQNLAYSDSLSNITVIIGNYTCTNITQTSLTSVTCNVPSPLLTAKSVGNYPVNVVVAGQQASASKLTFRVLSETSKTIVITTNKWWPLPWWCFVVFAGTVVIFFAIGLLVGCFAKRGGDAGGTTKGYPEERESLIINK